MTPSLNPILQGHYPLIDLLFDLEIAEERHREEAYPDDTLEDIREQLKPYCN